MRPLIRLRRGNEYGSPVTDLGVAFGKRLGMEFWVYLFGVFFFGYSLFIYGINRVLVEYSSILIDFQGSLF